MELRPLARPNRSKQKFRIGSRISPTAQIHAITYIRFVQVDVFAPHGLHHKSPLIKVELFSLFDSFFRFSYKFIMRIVTRLKNVGVKELYQGVYKKALFLKINCTLQNPETEINILQEILALYSIM